MPASGRTAVITGAAMGIGRAFAERLAREGLDIIAVDVDDATETVDAVQRHGRRASAYHCDVSDEDAVNTMAEEIRRAGRCDVLVNNVGIYPQVAFEDMTYAQWRRVFAVNLDSMFFMCKAFSGPMRERGWGRIINMSSGVTHQVIEQPKFAHYVTTKAAVSGLTKTLANEFASDAVTVNAIGPSIVQTPGNAHITDEIYAETSALQAIKRTSVPEDLVGALAFLASDDASFMTGQTLYVDGGLTRL